MALIKINNRSSEDNAVHGRRNLIINGAMQVAQRGTSFASATTAYHVDRFIDVMNLGAWTVSQSSDAPTGFSKSWKWDCTTANGTLASNSELIFVTRLEGQDLQHLKYGTANAESLTMSFWVKSSKTGTYTCEFDQYGDRQISKTYTINSANTWEHKTLTVPGDVAGSIDNDNSAELQLLWWLGAGSNLTSGTLNTSAWAGVTNANRVSSSQVNLADNTANDWYITGIQLEVGDKATPFEHQSFGDVLKQCERFYEKTYQYSTVPGTAASYADNIPVRINGLEASTSGQRYFVTRLRTEKRANPTTTYYNEAGNTGRCSTYDAGGTPDNGVNIGLSISGTSMQGFGPANGTWAGLGCYMTHDAEL